MVDMPLNQTKLNHPSRKIVVALFNPSLGPGQGYTVKSSVKFLSFLTSSILVLQLNAILY